MEARIWTGFPLPWDTDERLDVSALASILEGCVAAGTHGLYLGGASSEFFTLDGSAFTDAAAAFLTRMRAFPGTEVQVGCGGECLSDIEARIEWVVEQGCRKVQVPLPGWLALRDLEVIDLYRELGRRFPDVDLYVDDTGACGRRIEPHLWPRLLGAVSGIVGARIANADAATVTAIRGCRQHFPIMVGESLLAPRWDQRVRHVCTWMTCIFPDILPRLAAGLESRERGAIEEMVQLVDTIEHEIKDALRSRGFRAGSLCRLLGIASGVLPPVFGRVRRPWRNIEDHDVALARDLISRHLGQRYLTAAPN